MLKRGLIVSCQAEEGSPFNSPEFIVAFATAAELGGAVAVRICGIDNIRAVRQKTSLPIIGITKAKYSNGTVLITPTLDDVQTIVSAGADIVAFDATHRIRPDGLNGTAMVKAIKEHKRLSHVNIMADIAAFDEGMQAANSGADYIGTTLSGYTPYTKQKDMNSPDFDLVEKLAGHLPDQVIAEGRIWTPEQAKRMIDLGAYAVVVGTAITRPVEIVKRYAREIA